jgi:putative restriction endonuclease
MANLRKEQLLGKVMDAMREGGWLPSVLEGPHPYLIQAVSQEQAVFRVRLYIWNCTHGGTNRAADEYRIQFTEAPVARWGELTLVLGWHDEAGVFIGWDVAAHDGRTAYSSSAQVKESTLQAAHDRAFATQQKGNEIVVAFQPEFFVDYALGLASLHRSVGAHGDLALLDRLDYVNGAALAQVRDETRRIVIQQIARRYRASRFRGVVLSAYGHRCAFCGVQLGLLDAAHIVPVFSPGSSDEVNNGIALCKTHHHAYDSNLVAFDVDFRLLVNESRMTQLWQRGEGGGMQEFRAALSQYLFLPADQRNYPGTLYIERSFMVRGWRL